MTADTAIRLKSGDVYAFWYNEEETRKRFEPYHCFDGQLVVREINGELMLVDTYWGSGPNRTFTLKQALSEGHLSFKCNLSEVEPIQAWERDYFSDSDLFDLSHQHRCYTAHYKRKGACRSADKILDVLRQKVSDTRRKIERLQRDIEHMETAIEKVEAGDLSVHF